MRIWEADKRKVSDATTPYYIKCTKVPRACQLVVEQVAAMDVTTTCTSIRAGIWRRGKFWPFISEDTVVANELYYADVTIRLDPYEQLAFEFIGTEQADELYAWGYGIIVKEGESYTEKGRYTGR